MRSGHKKPGDTFGFLTIIRHLEDGHVKGQSYNYECLCRRCNSIVVIKNNKITKPDFFVKIPMCRPCNAEMRHLRAKILLRWDHMRQRCYNSKNKYYHRYGGRGIYICDEWLEDPYKFFLWALDQPNIDRFFTDKLSIDRIDNDGPYAPWNCRWATNQEQQKNKTQRSPKAPKAPRTAKGTTRSSLPKILRAQEPTPKPCKSKPPMKVYDIFGEKLGITDAYKKYGDPSISYTTAIARVKSGWDIEQALRIPKLGPGGAIRQGLNKVSFPSKKRRLHRPAVHSPKTKPIVLIDKRHIDDIVQDTRTKSRLKRVWSNFRNRCLCPNNPAYKDYGARGITVCEEWNRSKNFIGWAMKQPNIKLLFELNLYIDRIDNDKGYSPENCRFIDPVESAYNRRTSKR